MLNRATKTIVATIGVVLGFAGINHGFFEMMEGSKLTGGVRINGVSGSVGTFGEQLAEAG